MLKRLEVVGFKSFARKTTLDFSSNVTAIVGPNGSGKSNVAEAFRFAMGEQSIKSMRGKRSEDLIFNGSQSISRANRAAVAVVFDNTHRTLAIDFDEVVVERAVFRDGTSEYSVNGSRVRLRDIQELLARANIGESGHHIISQGEADRILVSSSKERRIMLEDALGLKMYEFKKQEALRKLEKTQENIKQVEALRKEVAPHVNFLRKQVKRLERTEALKSEIVALAREYFSMEDSFLVEEKKHTVVSLEVAEERLKVSAEELSKLTFRTEDDSREESHTNALHKAETKIEELVQARATLSREIGRVEGVLTETRRQAHAVTQDPYVKIPRSDIVALQDEVEQQTSHSSNEPQALRAVLSSIRVLLEAFFFRFGKTEEDYLAEEESTLHTLEQKRDVLVAKDTALENEVEHARNILSRIHEEVRAYEEAGKEGRRRLLDVAQTKARSEAEVVRLNGYMAEIGIFEAEQESNKREVVALVGPTVLSYIPRTESQQEPRAEQENRKKDLERLKIRLEESGDAGEDIRREFEEVSGREVFLSHELNDLAHSAKGLQILIEDLDTELAKDFAIGLEKVNTFFREFFALLFGGGGARLVIEETNSTLSGENESGEESDGGASSNHQERPGIEISVQLPKKRVQSLMQLSGGERALTSIALIFAMSQVNPPPFLILDETDTALDEANSRRYGDMIEALAKHSQLIVVTHNRETMSRAGILYGVTMNNNGISKLLSVKFDEAATVAKQ